MRVNHLSEAPDRQPTLVVVGSFDGVHRGHQAILQALIAAARPLGARTAVLTFFPHPKRVLQNLQGPYYLISLDERVQLLADQGIDLIITHPFDETLRLTRATEFVDQLCQALDMRQLWGGSFSLGYQREGTLPFLQKLGESRGFTVTQVPHQMLPDGRVISSSWIRAHLTTGNLAEVTEGLGRPFSLHGVVMEGAKRGRTIGFPTANLQFWQEHLLPPNGVYATLATLSNGERYAAATNVGVRPTVDGHTLTIEAHLLDFAGDLYGQTIQLAFIERVRSEMKFSGLEALKAQIATDVVNIRNSLQNQLNKE